MEWVEVTAKTVEEAQRLALDRLGVDVDDAEIEILQQPTKGLFGLMRGEARVRARVRPAAVRPKRDRRERGRRNRDRGHEGGTDTPAPETARVRDHDGDDADAGVAVDTRDRTGDNRRRRNRGGGGRTQDRNPDRNQERAQDGGQDRGQGRGERSNGARPNQKESKVEQESESVDPTAVGEAAAAFVQGLADALGAVATTEVVADGSELEVRLTGSDLGLLIGPGGRTLAAVQDLARVAAQRRLGDHETRLKVDVAGYREKRREALEKFARAVADDVLSTGRAKALEPMSSADRKIVHDAITGIDGVTSRSDGDDPARRVVISPA